MPATFVTVRDIPLGELARFPGNARRGDVAAIRSSLRRNGQYRALVVRDTGAGLVVLAGNHTRDALDAEGHGTARCEVIECSDDEARRINLADNRLAELGGYDDADLAELLASLDGDFDGTGWAQEDLDALLESGDGAGDADRPSLADRFLIPPFSVLDARQGWWQDRKKGWIGLGIQSEIGRGGDEGVRSYTSSEWVRSKGIKGNAANLSGVSIFDPVLCEVAYRWFSPPGGHVIDPFGGGSVRGVVAAVLGRTYAGNDLSAVQVDANGEQADDLAGRGILDRAAVSWSAGDSADWVTELEPGSADLVFTCPPYLWLERYSDDPADLSTMTADAFADAFTRILRGAADALRDNRFAVIVVGDARDKRGHLADLHGLTVDCAAKAGLALHTTAILVTAAGSLPVRVARQFTASRILGASHQDVLVFCKGSRQAAAKACGDVDVHIPDALAGEWGDDDGSG